MDRHLYTFTMAASICLKLQHWCNLQEVPSFFFLPVIPFLDLFNALTHYMLAHSFFMPHLLLLTFHRMTQNLCNPVLPQSKAICSIYIRFHGNSFFSSSLLSAMVKPEQSILAPYWDTSNGARTITKLSECIFTFLFLGNLRRSGKTMGNRNRRLLIE